MLALVFLSLTALNPEAKEALAARVAHSVVLLRVKSLSGDELAHGTGFVVRGDGLVVTNHHVVADAANLEAVFSDGRIAKVAGVVSDDPAHDLALVKLNATGLAALEFATSQAAVGASVYMFGSPVDLTFSFTEGIVSAVDRTLDHRAPSEASPADQQKHLQLQIATGSGASGSPIFDQAGHVVGVNRAGVGQGLGSVAFAVPIARVRELLSATQLDAAPNPIERPVPWLNVGISAMVLAGLVEFMRRRVWSPVGRGQPRAKRRFSGYEE
jgi:S1-C subfamily serine protease